MKRALVVTAAAVLPLAAVFIFAVPPTDASIYPKCLFHLLTGWHCPGCGSARCLHALLHGDFLQALAYNPLAVASLPFLALAAALRGYAEISGRPLPRRRLPAWSIRALFFVILAYWMLRNLPMAPFNLLAPHQL